MVLPDIFWSDMSETGRIICALILMVTALGAVGLRIISVKVTTATEAARRAATLSTPTGNGFAGKTAATLDRLVAGQAEIKAELRALTQADATTEWRLSQLEGKTDPDVDQDPQAVEL